MNSHSDSEVKLGENNSSNDDFTRLKKCIKKYKRRMDPTEDLKKIIHAHRMTFREKCLMTNASFNDVEGVEMLLKQGVDPNSCDTQLRTPLHVAAAKGYEQVVLMLLKYGANPNKHDIVLNTPLHLAACTSNLAVVVLLLNFGANINLVDLHGRNPMELAKSKLEILKKSFREGAIEMIKLRQQLEQIVEIMISIYKRLEMPDEDCKIGDLQLMKEAINTGPDTEMESNMSLIERQLQNFSIT